MSSRFVCSICYRLAHPDLRTNIEYHQHKNVNYSKRYTDREQVYCPTGSPGAFIMFVTHTKIKQRRKMMFQSEICSMCGINVWLQFTRRKIIFD